MQNSFMFLSAFAFALAFGLVRHNMQGILSWARAVFLPIEVLLAAVAIAVSVPYLRQRHYNNNVMPTPISYEVLSRPAVFLLFRWLPKTFSFVPMPPPRVRVRAWANYWTKFSPCASSKDIHLNVYDDISQHFIRAICLCLSVSFWTTPNSAQARYKESNSTMMV